MDGKLEDTFGRKISYVRIAVTDRCNFRCVYCMPPEGVPERTHESMLSTEQIARFVRVAAREGVSHVRLTGGEPLVSRRIIPLVRDIRSVPGIEDVALTTNGVLLPRLAASLRDAGLDRVNVSLDTLDPAQFRAITRGGELEQTLAGIDAALAAGFEPVKINCVVVRRLKQDLFGLAKMTLDRPLHVRFIEYMPIGRDDGRPFEATDAQDPSVFDSSRWNAGDTVPSEELVRRLSAEGERAGVGPLMPVGEDSGPAGAGPARYWRYAGAAGTVGCISAMSNHFCARCNRMRLTVDGAIRPCLFSDAEYPVFDALRAGDDERIRAVFRAAVAHKPRQHAVIAGTERYMSQIGG